MVGRRILQMAARFATNRAGNVGVIFAVGALPMMGTISAGMDLVRAQSVRTELQGAIDASALAAARARADGRSNWNATAQEAFKSNLSLSATATASLTDAGWKIDGVASVEMPTTFSGLFNLPALTVRAAASAAYGAAPGSSSNTPPASTPPGSASSNDPSGGGGGASGGGGDAQPPPESLNGQSGSGGSATGFAACILVTHPSMQSAIHMNSGSRIETNCGVQVNSNDRDAIWINSGARLESPANRVGGGVNTNNGGQISAPPQTYQPALEDPLANLAEPTTGASCTGVTVNSGQTLTLNPGAYCGHFNVNSGATLYLRPGTYVFSTHVNVNAGASINGEGVTLFFAPGGMLQANSGSRWTLSAPTSGTYRGILVFYARNNSTDLILNSAVQDEFNGVIYAPASRLLINSGMDLDSDVALIVNNIHINGRITIGRPMGSCGASATMAPQLQTGCSVTGGSTSSGGSSSGPGGGGPSGGSTPGATTPPPGSGGSTTPGGASTATPPTQSPIRLVQ
jgi:Flp pilus assembly protein TadG